MLLLSPGEVMALNRAQPNDVQWGQTAAPGSGLGEGHRGCTYRAGRGERDPELRIYERLQKGKAQPVLPGSSSGGSEERCRAGRILHPPPLCLGLQSKRPTARVQGWGGPRGVGPLGSEGSPQTRLPTGLAFRGWGSGDVFGKPGRH